jgi:hypothetical protein
MNLAEIALGRVGCDPRAVLYSYALVSVTVHTQTRNDLQFRNALL